MEFLFSLADIFLHLDKHLGGVIQDYGHLTYFILFMIIFCETGLVVTPFLPGDSLLFAAGAFAAVGALDVMVLFFLLVTAAMLGNSTNYFIGFHLGPRIFQNNSSKLLNKRHLEKTHEFYEKYGGKTIIIARFVPIVRTFAPFIAGLGRMTYLRFLSYDVVGGTGWIAICVFAGYFFGNIPFVKQNFSIVIMGIIFISILPALIEIIKHRLASKALA